MDNAAAAGYEAVLFFNKSQEGRREVQQARLRVDERRQARTIAEDVMLSIAFAALGLLVGNLTGLSGSPIASALVPALFALVGGSFIAFLSNVPEKDRGLAAGAITSFSLACLAGAYLGIFVNSNQLIGPRVAQGEHYLRKIPPAQVDVIDQRKRAGQLDAEQAYEELLSLIQRQ